jgi:SAM-dependent methyltransferase
MTAEYDHFARQYKTSKELPFRVHVEAYTLAGMLGDVDGLSVLDLACGEGYYTRLIRRRGAARVVGVDISAAMIALAEEQEEREPLGVEYLCQDAGDLGPIGPFDVVTAAYLLNYAPSRERLRAMCRAIASNLRPGGRFVAINSNFGPGPLPDTSKYGWTPVEPTAEEGEAYHLTFLGPDGFTIENTCYSHASYERALREAGFSSVRWRPVEVSDEGVQEFGEDYWRDFLSSGPIIGIECRMGPSPGDGRA